ncbi:VOC family protein [Xylanimonas sp. McL0601]|uniref:VOC family protein n=1 Tax=Xylanimonas sp. McL0601 TaxID=3414739 RepID=UPI003CE9B58A
MDQHVSLVTLVVTDIAASRRFYVDGLGWVPELEAPGEVLMFRVAQHTLLSLWDEQHSRAELGPVTRGGTPPMTLAHNLRTRAEVDAALELARSAGAVIVSDAVEREWGGYSGYFADPDGFRWEIAMNPGPIGETMVP